MLSRYHQLMQTTPDASELKVYAWLVSALESEHKVGLASFEHNVAICDREEEWTAAAADDEEEAICRASFLFSRSLQSLDR